MALEKRIVCDATTGKTKEETFDHTPLSLTEVKQQKIAEIKRQCSEVINKTYPVYKQLNISNLSGHTQLDKDNMLVWIKDKRDKSNLHESQVNAATTIAEVNAIVITW